MACVIWKECLWRSHFCLSVFGYQLISYAQVTDCVLLCDSVVTAVYVATPMELSESMGSCAADNAFTAMPRRLVSSSTVDLH
nr:hypothetical protein [Tanacetum cinerariifolium]